MIPALAISLWVSACIPGTLHGEPVIVCSPELQLPHRYETVAACESGRKKAISDWLVDMKLLGPHIRTTERCGPSEKTEDDI